MWQGRKMLKSKTLGTLYLSHEMMGTNGFIGVSNIVKGQFLIFFKTFQIRGLDRDGIHVILITV